MTEVRLKVMEAIARRRVLEADYNGARVRLAPHLMFERHGDHYVSALNLDKKWRDGEEVRLGQYKLAGLSSPEVFDEAFEPLPSFTAVPPLKGDIAILGV